MIDFPWWFGLLLLFIAFMYYVGIGATLGFVVTYAMLARSVRKGNEAFGSRADRMGMSFVIGCIGSGFIQALIVEIALGAA